MFFFLAYFTGNNNPVYEAAKETLMYRTVLWTLWERERVGGFGRMHRVSHWSYQDSKAHLGFFSLIDGSHPGAILPSRGHSAM